MTDQQRIRFANRFFTVALVALALGLLWVLLEVFTAGSARAETVRIILRQDVPTVSGIEASPSPAPFYRRPVTVHSGPSAGVYEVEPAPPNGCERPAFRVISGPRSGRGCLSSE
jgi:hypothetical protein